MDHFTKGSTCTASLIDGRKTIFFLVGVREKYAFGRQFSFLNNTTICCNKNNNNNNNKKKKKKKNKKQEQVPPQH